MDRVKIGPVKGLRIAVTAFVLSVFLAVAVIGGAVYLWTLRSGDLEDFSTELRVGLVKSCQRNGNPLREAVRDQLLEQIKQRERLDYTRFFPNVPPEELRRLLAEQTAADRLTLKRIAPVDCAAQFPRP